MCGDVNFFLTKHENEETQKEELHAEIEVMIAEPSSRRKGIATEAILLMMQYGLLHLKIDKFVAKIIKENQESLNMFTSKLKYKVLRFVEYFEQYELEWDATLDENKKSLAEQTSHAVQEKYH